MVYDGTSSTFVPSNLSESVLQTTVTNTTTDVNVAAPGADMPVFGSSTTFGAGSTDFTVISATQVRANFTGTIVVNLNLPMTSADERVSVHVRLEKGGIKEGPLAASGYIRNNSAHNTSSVHISGYYMSVTNGDIITVAGEQGSEAGAVNLVDNGTISMKRIR